MYKIYGSVLCLVLCFCTNINGQFFGNDPVRFDVETLEHCGDNPIWDWHIKVLTINDTHISASANFTLDRDFDNQVSFIAEFLQQNSKKEWRKVAKLAKKNSCSFLRNLAGQLFVDVCKELGASGKCPVTKGAYKIDNRLIDVQSTPLAKFLTGKFRGIISGYSPKKETLFCGEVVFTSTKIKI